MKATRAILAFLWLLFGLTATAHAGNAPKAEPPCHVAQTAPSHSHLPPAPRDDQTVMPCCNQPVLVAPAEIAVPQAAGLQLARLTPAIAPALTDHIPTFEPRPPKTA